MKANRRQYLERDVQGTMGATLAMSGLGGVRITAAEANQHQ